ncbi:MAG: hypothetical protein KF878_13860 [Planctomycetes bacterium]|nr:hypothetical protein [Planctomycetota bacterium]
MAGPLGLEADRAAGARGARLVGHAHDDDRRVLAVGDRRGRRGADLDQALELAPAAGRLLGQARARLVALEVGALLVEQAARELERRAAGGALGELEGVAGGVEVLGARLQADDRQVVGAAEGLAGGAAEAGEGLLLRGGQRRLVGGQDVGAGQRPAVFVEAVAARGGA